MGSSLPQAASAMAAAAAMSSALFMVIPFRFEMGLELVAATLRLRSKYSRVPAYNPTVVLGTAGKEADQISWKRERIASASVSSCSPIAPRQNSATGRRR